MPGLPGHHSHRSMKFLWPVMFPDKLQEKTAGIAPKALPIYASLPGSGCPSVPTTPTRNIVGIRAKIMSETQSVVLQGSQRDKLTFLCLALEVARLSNDSRVQ